LLAILGAACVYTGWVTGLVILLALFTLALIALVKGIRRVNQMRPAIS
jgi:hypothetical protein